MLGNPWSNSWQRCCRRSLGRRRFFYVHANQQGIKTEPLCMCQVLLVVVVVGSSSSYSSSYSSHSSNSSNINFSLYSQ